jgi:hypothetical protein
VLIVRVVVHRSFLAKGLPTCRDHAPPQGDSDQRNNSAPLRVGGFQKLRRARRRDISADT